MTLASIESPSRTATSAKIDLPETAGTPNDRPANSEFGQIMSEVLQTSAEIAPLPTGQEMAASAELQTGWPGSFGGNLSASLGGDFLKAVHLGPHMNVITSEAAVPDEQSLEAFARSQGLDETAVQWLMGSSPTAPVPLPSKDMGAAVPLDSTTLLSGVNLISPKDGSSALNPIEASAQALAASLGKSGSTPGIDSPLKEMAQVGSTNTAAQDSSPAAAPVANTPVADTSFGNQVGGKDGMPHVALSTNGLSAALWAMTQGTEKARVTPPPAPEDPSEVAKVQINLMASPAPAAFWMLRNPMVAAQAKEAVSTSAGMSVSEIDLSQAATPELLDSLNQALAEGASLNTSTAASDHPTPLSGHPGHRVDLAAVARQDAQNPDASASAPDSGNAQRSENVQNLAEKMGQAVGQRILSEIEKGQWHLKLSLRPATLGHIEVEMRMRSGELDAVFTASQALTRELLQEGMSKLKDTLSQMGMDVASMQVGDGQTQKRGGDSTPEQMSKSANGNVDDPQSSLSATQAPTPRMKMGQDGWDVLV